MATRPTSNFQHLTKHSILNKNILKFVLIIVQKYKHTDFQPAVSLHCSDTFQNLPFQKSLPNSNIPMEEERKSQTGRDFFSKHPSSNASPTCSTNPDNTSHLKTQPPVNIKGNPDPNSLSQLSTKVTDLINESTSDTSLPEFDPSSLQLCTYITYLKPDDSSFLKEPSSSPHYSTSKPKATASSSPDSGTSKSKSPPVPVSSPLIEPRESRKAKMI